MLEEAFAFGTMIARLLVLRSIDYGTRDSRNGGGVISRLCGFVDDECVCEGATRPSDAATEGLTSRR